MSSGTSGNPKFFTQISDAVFSRRGNNICHKYCSQRLELDSILGVYYVYVNVSILAVCVSRVLKRSECVVVLSKVRNGNIFFVIDTGARLLYLLIYCLILVQNICFSGG